MTRLAASTSRGSVPICPGRQLNDRLVLPMWIPTEPFWNAMIGVAVLPAVIPPAPALISRPDGADGRRGGARSGAQMGCLTDLRGT